MLIFIRIFLKKICHPWFTLHWFSQFYILFSICNQILSFLVVSRWTCAISFLEAFVRETYLSFPNNFPLFLWNSIDHFPHNSVQKMWRRSADSTWTCSLLITVFKISLLFIVTSRWQSVSVWSVLLYPVYVKHPD